jgi:hypothetical protein
MTCRFNIGLLLVKNYSMAPQRGAFFVRFLKINHSVNYFLRYFFPRMPFKVMYGANINLIFPLDNFKNNHIGKVVDYGFAISFSAFATICFRMQRDFLKFVTNSF